MTNDQIADLHGKLDRSLKSRRRLRTISRDLRILLEGERAENIQLRRVLVDLEKGAVVSHHRNDCLIRLAEQIDHEVAINIIAMLKEQILTDLPPRRFVELDAYLGKCR